MSDAKKPLVSGQIVGITFKDAMKIEIAPIRIDVYLHQSADSAITQKLDAILTKLDQLEEQIRRACAEIVLSEEVRIALEQILTRLRAL